MENKILIIYTTLSDPPGASELSDALISEKLAACTNKYSIESRFMWKGNFECNDEVSLIIKTLPEKENEVRSWLEENHPYDTPAILSWEVKVNAGFREWVQKCCT